MSWALTAMAGSAVLGFLGSENQASAAESAANTSGAASAAAIAEQRRQFDIAQANQKPWIDAGTNALAQMQTGIAPGGSYAQRDPFSFTGDQYLANQDPGYGFQMSEGLKALDRTAAARGGALSGRAGKEAMRYGQGLASTDYQNAFNRALTGYNSQGTEMSRGFNQLASLAGTGQTATNQINSQGAAMANNIGGYGMTNAANQAGATLTGAAARNSAYGGMSNMLGSAAFSPYSPFRSTGGGGGGYQNIIQNSAIDPINYANNYG